MNPRRLEVSVDLLRDVNRFRLLRATLTLARPECDHWVKLCEHRLEQHDADARARADVRQTSIFDELGKQLRTRQP